jgi:hypothetical protein
VIHLLFKDVFHILVRTSVKSVLLVPCLSNLVALFDIINIYRYGLPVVGNVPGGFSPLLELYGKGKNRFPLLVQFNHPVTWVVTTPMNDLNGEGGTVQAGEYAKGDTATFFVYTEKGHVDVRNVAVSTSCLPGLLCLYCPENVFACLILCSC